jgi:hypothetical protein
VFALPTAIRKRPAVDNSNFVATKELQFADAPDDAVILHRKIQSPKVFAYEVRVH